MQRIIYLDAKLENLRIFREMFGYSQEYLGEQLGISHTAYAKMERGETQLTETKLHKYCEVVGIEKEKLYEFDKNSYKKNKRVIP